MTVVLSVLTALGTGTAHADDLSLPALSPSAEVMQAVGVVEMRLRYSSPAKRERTIWGDLVPWGEMWRTGANMATTLETDGPIRVGGTTVEAGKYALFTIPGEESWTVILNGNPDQGGTGDYDEALDVARLEVTPQQGASRERLTFLFSDTTAESTRLDLVWDGVRVEIPITIDTNGLVDAGVARFTSHAEGSLTAAARHYARIGDLERALELVDTAISIEENWFNVWIKADILHQSGSRKARRVAKRAKVLGDEAENFFWKDRVENAIATW